MAFNFPQIDWNVEYFKDGKPTQEFQILWGQVAASFEAVTLVAQAQAAADSAQASADTAQTAAASAESSADGANSVASLTASGVTGCTITATDAGANVTVTISAHTRVYGDGTNRAVNGGSLTGLAYSTLYYIYYDDAARTGGAVTYASTTSETTAAQTGNRHLVGQVTTPAAAAPPETGDNVRPPGVGGILP